MFVSIGDSIKLNKFLEINPYIPRDTIFVDGYGMGAYESAGFQQNLAFGMSLPEGYVMKPPGMGGLGGWWKYFSNVASISPAPSETVTREDVLGVVAKLGGTFVIDGDNVIFQWNDAIPGDHPDLDDIRKLIIS